MSKVSVFRLLLLVSCYFAASASLAQNTSGVFGPVVDEGKRSAQYRFSVDPDSDALAHRFHYQQSYNDDLLWRVVMQARDTSDSSLDFDFLRGELFWQLSPNDTHWHYGFRLDYRVRDGDRPDEFGINFTNQLRLTSKLSIRAIFLSSVDLGDNADDGISLGTRARFRYRAHSNISGGLEMFSRYGSTSDLDGFDDQRHQIGPYAILRLPDGWHATVSALSGVTDASPDTHLRVFLGRSF